MFAEVEHTGLSVRSLRGHMLWTGRVLLVPLVLIMIWQIVHTSGIASPSLLPSPWTTFKACGMLFYSGEILRDIEMTALRTGCGYGLAVIVGISLGLLIGTYKPLYDTAILSIDFVRSVPVTILFPVFVLVLGISHASKIGMVFTGCVFIIALNTAYGVMQSNKTRKQMAVLYGASKWQIFLWILFFDSLPQTMVGLRVTLSLSLVIEILCEMFMGSQHGLGQRVTEAYTTYLIAEMYGLILIVGVFGFGLNRVFVLIEKKVVPWSTQGQR